MGKHLADKDIVVEEGDRLGEDGIIVVQGRSEDPLVEYVLQFFFLIVPSYYSFIPVVYLLGEVDAFTPIPHIFSFIPHLHFVSSIFPWT